MAGIPTFGGTMPQPKFEQTVDPKRVIYLEQAVLNLQKICSSLMDLYTGMHTILLAQLVSQLGFDAAQYTARLQDIFNDISEKKERLEDELYNIEVVKDSIRIGDLVRLIVECSSDKVSISNADVGGSYYTIGKQQLVSALEEQVIGKVMGDKFELDSVDGDGTSIHYKVSVEIVKRGKAA